MFYWKWKSELMEKVSLYKFTHIPLLKNGTQLKQKKKVTNNQKKKSPKFIKKIKIMFKNKSHLNKKKKQKQKQKQKKKKETQKKAKKKMSNVHWIPAQ